MPKNQEYQAALIMVVCLILACVSYYFDLWILFWICFAGITYAAGYEQGYRRAYWECGKPTPTHAD
jgi:hypothetical protein